MLSRPYALALVAAGCMAAAGLGAYVAVRQAAVPAAAGAAAPSVAQPAEAAPAAVAETEAVVEPPAADGETPEVERAPKPEPPVAAPVHNAARSTEKPAAPPVKPDAPAERSRPVKELDESRPAQPPLEATPVIEGEPLGVALPTAPEPAEALPVYEELIVSADSVLGLQLESSVSSETARVEDPVEARVIRDVSVAGKVAVPAGTRVLGTVTIVEPGGKVKERARLGVRFHTLVLADTTEVPIQTDGIFREGDPPSDESVKKIGGAAVGGAILGAILGGTKGAVIGGATGAGAGTAAVMAGGRNPAVLPAGSTLTVRLVSPVTITIER